MQDKKQKKEKAQKPQLPDKGHYETGFQPDAADKTQKRKTLFMLLGILCFAIDLFLPSQTKNLHASVSYVFLIFNILAILVCVVTSYRGRNKHKIRAQIDFYDAPKKGFKKSTYILYEIFTVTFLLLLAEQIAIAVLLKNIAAILGVPLMALGAGFVVYSRFVLYNANKDAVLIEPEKTAEEKEADEFYN